MCALGVFYHIRTKTARWMVEFIAAQFFVTAGCGGYPGRNRQSKRQTANTDATKRQGVPGILPPAHPV
jgi:hypothetical protein